MCMLPFPGRPYALARRPGRRACDGCRAPRGLFSLIIFPASQVRRNTPTHPATPRGRREPSRAARERVRAAEHRSARAASVFKQRCDPKADGLLERPGEAFCPAKFIKLGLEGRASSPDPALGAIAPVIDACRTLHQPRNPFARHHEARFRRRAEPRGPGFRTHRSPPEPRGSQIQKLYKRR